MREKMHPDAVAVLRQHQKNLAPDLAAVVEAVFRLGHFMGRMEGLVMRRHNGQPPRGKAVKK